MRIHLCMWCFSNVKNGVQVNKIARPTCTSLCHCIKSVSLHLSLCLRGQRTGNANIHGMWFTWNNTAYKDNGGEDWSFRSHMHGDRQIFITSWKIPSRHICNFPLEIGYTICTTFHNKPSSCSGERWTTSFNTGLYSQDANLLTLSSSIASKIVFFLARGKSSEFSKITNPLCRPFFFS